MKKFNLGNITALIAIPALLYYGYVAFSWGLADAYARPAMNTIRDSKKAKLELTQEDWARYRVSLGKSLNLDPGNPETLRYLGKVSEGPYSKFQLGDKEARASRQKAAEYFRESIKLRPTWPYGYADLALVKFRLLEIDEEFYEAMYASIEYGPWEPDIQRLVVEMGMVLWNILETKDRQFILDIARRSFMHANKTHVSAMRRMINQRQFVDRVCEESGQNVDLLKYCGGNGN